MLPPAAVRQRLARALTAAYAEGVLSERTLVQRLELLLERPLVDVTKIVGDLPRRNANTALGRTMKRVTGEWRAFRYAISKPRIDAILLGLDWEGGHSELLIGRDSGCEVVLDGSAVSRRHARLTFRDGAWILQDLDSTNGTILNGQRVGRCKLKPGDRLVIGDEHLLVD